MIRKGDSLSPSLFYYSWSTPVPIKNLPDAALGVPDLLAERDRRVELLLEHPQELVEVAAALEALAEHGHLEVGAVVRGGADAHEVGCATLHHLNEDGHGAAGVVHGHGDGAQGHLGPRRVVHVLPNDTFMDCR